MLEVQALTEGINAVPCELPLVDTLLHLDCFYLRVT